MLLQAVGTIMPEALFNLAGCKSSWFWSEENSFLFILRAWYSCYYLFLDTRLLKRLSYVATLTIFKALACTFKHGLAALLYLTVPAQWSLEIPVTILWYLDKRMMLFLCIFIQVPSILNFGLVGKFLLADESDPSQYLQSVTWMKGCKGVARSEVFWWAW